MDRSMSPAEETKADLPNLPSPFVPRRLRTKSTSERGLQNPKTNGTIVNFCRTKGHGFVRVDGSPDADPPVFVHVSDVDGEYVPVKGDRVTFHLCPVPPKLDKYQAIHVRIIDFCHSKHHKWCEPPTEQELLEAAGQNDNSFIN